jgi:hypothetical protein
MTYEVTHSSEDLDIYGSDDLGCAGFGYSLAEIEEMSPEEIFLKLKEAYLIGRGYHIDDICSILSPE